MEFGTLIMLAASLLTLIIGPSLFRIFESRQHFYRLMDGFIVVVITGIVILEVMPEVLGHIPMLGVLLIVAGFAGPTVLERLFHKAARQVHRTALLIGVAGIVLHTIVDGVILCDLPVTGGNLLAWGIILHRLPVGITIWWLIEPRYGKNAALSVFALMILGTVGGYLMGLEMTALTAGEGGLLLKALVAGAILHVVIHRPQSSGHKHDHDEKALVRSDSLPTGKPAFRWAEGVGNLIGLGVLGAILFFHTETDTGHGHLAYFAGETATVFWGMALESAPALLLAYLFGGLISVFLPATSIRWMKRGPALGRSVKGMLVGLPLPICTCGVLPLYRTLIKKGAPATAAMAFLIATPELGLDALLISIPLLGGDMTMVRLGAAALIALLIGWVVGLWTEKTTSQHTEEEETHGEEPAMHVTEKIRNGLREGFGGLVDDTAPWILTGLMVAALANPLLSQGWIQALPPGVEVLFFAMLGLPIYVCASGATPIVAVLLINGVSPGAALAFLLTGPATNISTFGILAQVHNRKVAIVFGFATMIIAISLGIGVNVLWPSMALLSSADLALEQTSLFQQLSLILLFGIFMVSLLRRGARAFVGEVTSSFRLTAPHAHSHVSEPEVGCGDHCERC